MRYQRILLLLLLPFILIVCAAGFFYSDSSVTSQTRDQKQNSNKASSTPTPAESGEVVKVDVDLVKIDALVLQKKTARIVGGLKKEDFQVYEDGTKQDITHFSQDELPLSVILVIDRGRSCPLEPYSVDVQRAAREAIDRLKPVDEVAVMAFADSTRMIQPFTRNRILLENALHHIPEQAQNPTVLHCFNNLFADAADHMVKASNPAGRRVVIVITGRTRLFDCADGPSNKSATSAIYESGSVVCAIVPRVTLQPMENAVQIMATRLGRIAGADYMDIQNLANETGGEVMSDKLEKLETTFQTLIDHLRSRYNLAFVSTNKKRDGTTRKLKLDLDPTLQKSQGKLVIKARRSYIAPRN